MSAILDYWKSHPEYWIALGPRQAEADKEITALFWNSKGKCLTKASDWLSSVVYYDQFLRHFSRVPETGITEDVVNWGRKMAVDDVYKHKELLFGLGEDECYFCLMALKHAGDYETIFSVIHAWVPVGKSLTDFPILSRFYNDTYKKAYTDEVVRRDICRKVGGEFDPAKICDSYPPALVAEPELPTCAESLLLALRAKSTEEPLILSLSGGVDSMVMCTLLKRDGIKFTAVHIVYGNRSCSDAEAAFIQDYCKRLDVPVIFYKIKWLRRGFVEREFYESMTRALRFAVYRCASEAVAAPKVLLGHIRDDMIENVWTNLAKCTHLDDPAVLKTVTVEDGVTVCRPWITVKKDDIYAVAQAMGIPYLKNTTPAWSNRGKFRDGFYHATHAQYGASVDDKILETAAALQKQAGLIHKLLYAPMLDSWDSDDRCCMITRGVEAELDGVGWSTFFTALCHSKLGITKPSIHACGEFGARVQRSFDGSLKIHMKKDLTVLVEKYEDDYVLIVRDTDHPKPLSVN